MSKRRLSKAVNAPNGEVFFFYVTITHEITNIIDFYLETYSLRLLLFSRFKYLAMLNILINFEIVSVAINCTLLAALALGQICWCRKGLRY